MTDMVKAVTDGQLFQDKAPRPTLLLLEVIMITDVSKELARRAFIAARVDQIMQHQRVKALAEVIVLHVTKLDVALGLICDNPTGQMRNVEGALALKELLEDAAVDMAEAEWHRDIANNLPLREAA